MDKITLRQKEYHEHFDEYYNNDETNYYDSDFGREKGYEKSIVRTRRKDITVKRKTHCSVDLGCGTGVYITEISKYAQYTIGADFCYNWMVKANRKYGSDKIFFVNCDAQNLPFAWIWFIVTMLFIMSMTERRRLPRWRGCLRITARLG